MSTILGWPKKILFLDGSDFGYLRIGKGVEVITEADLGNYNPTEAPIEFLEELIKTPSDPYNLVVLGGDMRPAAPAKARKLNLGLRRKTIIVSDFGLSTIENTIYKEMGFSLFMTREQLREELPRLLR